MSFVSSPRRALLAVVLVAAVLVMTVVANEAAAEAEPLVEPELELEPEADGEANAEAKVASMDTELLFGVITPACWDVFASQHDFTNVECIKVVVSKLLGYAIIAGAFILKLPQIMKIIAAKDVTGLTPSSFYMEVLLCLSTSIYNVLREYPLSTWGETLVILVQNLVLVVLLWMYSRPAISMATRLALVVAFVALTVGMFLTPPEHQWLLASAGIPVSIAARIPQVVSNFQQGHTGQLAFVTLVLNLGGTVARLFTTLQETGDPVQLVAYGVSVVLNGLLVLQVVIYWSATTKALAQATQKKTE